MLTPLTAYKSNFNIHLITILFPFFYLYLNNTIHYIGTYSIKYRIFFFISVALNRDNQWITILH